MQHRARTDPVERVIQLALEAAGLDYVDEGDTPQHLDFYLPRLGLHIECKRLGTPRTEAQLARAENVLVVQGLATAHAVAAWIMGAAQCGSRE